MADADESRGGSKSDPAWNIPRCGSTMPDWNGPAPAAGLTWKGKVRIYPSDAFLKRNINRTPEQHLAHTHGEIARFKELGIPVRDASVSNAFGCNFQGDIPLARVIECVGQLLDLAREHDIQFEKISLADTMAWATPHAIKRMIGAMREALS